MKGITPVITTVLLLLMAVSAVGGAWVWYQRMQNSAISGGSGQVEQLKQTAVSISVDQIKCESGTNNFLVTLANVGTESVTLTNFTLATSSGGSTVAYKDSWTISSNSLNTGNLTGTCSTGTTYYASARIGAQYVIRDYPATAK